MSEEIDLGEDTVRILIRRDFQKEIKHAEKMFGFFLKIYRFLSRHSGDILTEHDYVKWSTLLLFMRNFRILRCAYRSMLNGYYDVSFAELRMAFENHLLMFFLSLREEEAKKWWYGKRFTPRFLKREVREKLSYDEVYKSLSNFIHTDFKITRFFIKERGKALEVWVTEYDSKHFYGALQGLFSFGLATLMLIIKVFRDSLKEETFENDIKDFNSLTKRILKDARKKAKS